jgi:hypothetical protein
MPRVGFESTIPAFEQAKTVHASDRAAAVIGEFGVYVRTNYVYMFSICKLLVRQTFVRNLRH